MSAPFKSAQTALLIAIVLAAFTGSLLVVAWEAPIVHDQIVVDE